MTWLGESSKIRNSVIAYGVSAVLIITVSVLYWTSLIKDEKWLALLAGLLSGFIVAVVQLGLSIREQQKLDKYESMGVLNVLNTRDDPAYYRELIENAAEEIRIHGVTCKRFLDDFASLEDRAPEKNRVLLRALDRDVRVKILVTRDEYLLDEEQKRKLAAARIQLAALGEKYPGVFLYAEYDHEPAHSIFLVDRQSIVGPSFPHVSSKFSPAIHLRAGSSFAERYLEYFDQEWEKWSSDRTAS